MRNMVMVAIGAATLVSGCASTGFGNDAGYGAYDYNRPDPRQGGYYADQYYRDGPRYRERRLGNNDRVYRGRNGQYYCRRNDGTTGLIVGGLAGGVLGTAIAPGGSGLLGAILGGAGGAVLGKEVTRDRNDVRCR